ncbi:MAG: pimeloyl-ACP methyl ester esterase BioH [Gammaproteobacteria bacterium]
MRLYSETYGSGELLVLVHGWAMHSGIWRAFAQRLAQRYQVVCVDLPGHGRSAVQPFTLQQIRRALLETVPAEVCHWLGWSLGSSVVLDIAVHAPERVKSLTVIAGNPSFIRRDHWPGLELPVLEKFAAALEADCQTTLARFLALQVHGLENSKELLKTLKQTLFECAAPNPVTLYGGLELLKRADFRPALLTLDCPLNVILGGRDTFVPIAVGDAINRLLPGVEICRIDKAGHVPFISHEQWVVEKVLNFMARTR